MTAIERLQNARDNCHARRYPDALAELIWFHENALAEEPALRATGTIVEVDHPKRGKYLTVGNPIKLSDSPTVVRRSPLLGEHTEEVLGELGYSTQDIDGFRTSKVI